MMEQSNSPIQFEKRQLQSHKPKHAMAANDAGKARLLKASTMTDGVTFTTETTGTVLSSDGSKEYHFVLSFEDQKHTCECPDYSIRGNICKHIRAALMKHTENKLTTEADNK